MAYTSSSFTLNFENSSSSNPFLSYTFHTQISLKLDDQNFLIWQQKVLAIVKSLKLLYFLEDQEYPHRFNSLEDVITPIMSIPNIYTTNNKISSSLQLLASMTTPILTKWWVLHLRLRYE